MSWKELSALGREYKDIFESKYGPVKLHETTEESIDEEVKNRTPRQKEIAEQLTLESRKLVYQIALELANNGQKRIIDRIVRIRKDVDIEDLVQEGLLGVYRNIGIYRPEKSFSTYVSLIATTYMERFAARDRIIRMPIAMFVRTIRMGGSKNEKIAKIMDGLKGVKEHKKSTIAEHVYFAMTQEYDDLWGDYKDGYRDRLEDRIVGHEPVDFEVLDPWRFERVKTKLNGLDEQTQEIMLRLFYNGDSDRDVAKDWGIRRSQIRYLKDKTLRELQKEKLKIEIGFDGLNDATNVTFRGIEPKEKLLLDNYFGLNGVQKTIEENLIVKVQRLKRKYEKGGFKIYKIADMEE